MRGVAARAKELERELAAVEEDLQGALAPLPNLPDSDSGARPRGRADQGGGGDRRAARLRAARSSGAGGGEDRHGSRRASVGLALCLSERRSGDARARARALGAREVARAWLRARDPAGARARAGALRDRLPARHRAADLLACRRTSCSSSAPPRSRSPRCTTRRSSTPSACRCATRASRPAFAVRPARPGRTRAGSSGCTSSTRSRCSASSSRRSPPASTSGSWRSRRRSSRSWICPTAS